MLLLCMPATAQRVQHRQRSTISQRIEDAREGTPGYYEIATRKLFKQGKWEEGRQILQKGLNKYETISALNELMGEYWLHLNQYDKARFFLIRSLRDNSDNLHSKEMLMKIEERTKHYSSAIVYCNELLETSPYDYNLWKKKIELYRLQGNTAEATRLLNRLREIYPEKQDVKKEIAYDLETKYRQYRTKKNLEGQEDMLKQLVKIDPKNEEFQMALCNLYLQTGRTEAALDAAGYAASVVAKPYPFVEKKASILGEMTRYSEALSYLREAQSNIPALAAHSGEISQLSHALEEDAARMAVQNDPYTAYAKIYEKEHSDEALNYLLNTATTRGYLDDALVYVRQARKRYGDTQKLLYREYTIQRRLGNDKAATAMLVKMHSKWPNDREICEELCAIRLGEARSMMDFGQYHEAIATLEEIRQYNVDEETMSTIEHRLFSCYQQTGNRAKATLLLNNICKDPIAKAGLYEEISLPYIKQLIGEGKLYHADKEIQATLDMGNPSADLLRMGINTSLQMKKGEKARSLASLGRKRFPDDPFFTLKEAQFKAEDGNYKDALEQLRPMLEFYMGDTTLVNAYAECSDNLAQKHLKAKNYEIALNLVNDALQYQPDNQSLIHTKAMIYQAMKDWDNAVATYKLYRPSLAESQEYVRNIEAMKFHLMKNQVNIEYQLARPASQDQITSTALVSYTHFATGNNYTINFGYAGRDGLIKPVTADDEKGGTGVAISGEWEHTWNDALTSTIIAGCANKFFPRFRLEAKASYALPHEWTAKGALSYRMVSAYYNTSLIGVGLGGTKGIERFNFGADLHLLILAGKESEYISGKFFANASAVAKYYPIKGNRTNIFISGSVGNAPEISLIDYNMPVKFNQLNTMFGIGGTYAINSVIDFGIMGSWYSMTINPSTDNDADRNKNYLYLNANVTIHF